MNVLLINSDSFYLLIKLILWNFKRYTKVEKGVGGLV